MKKLNLQGADSLAGKTELWATVGLNLCAVEEGRAVRTEVELGYQENLARSSPQYGPKPVLSNPNEL